MLRAKLSAFQAEDESSNLSTCMFFFFDFAKPPARGAGPPTCFLFGTYVYVVKRNIRRARGNA